MRSMLPDGASLTSVIIDAGNSVAYVDYVRNPEGGGFLDQPS